MTQPLPIQVDRTAVVIMDFQNRMVNNVADQAATVIGNANQVLAAARSAGMPIIYVQHRGGALEADAPEVEFHVDIAPKQGDRLLRKVRTGPFSSTPLDVLLREQGKDTIVLMGISTSGCVLSTVRWGADINYRIVVVKDACADADPEVHRVLTEKLFPRQGTVLTAEEFVAQVAGSPARA